MVDSLQRRPSGAPLDGAGQGAPVKHHDRDSKFAKALFAALKPPSIDNAEAAGDFENEEATKAPMKVTILPNASIKAALAAPNGSASGKLPGGS